MAEPLMVAQSFKPLSDEDIEQLFKQREPGQPTEVASPQLQNFFDKNPDVRRVYDKVFQGGTLTPDEWELFRMIPEPAQPGLSNIEQRSRQMTGLAKDVIGITGPAVASTVIGGGTTAAGGALGLTAGRLATTRPMWQGASRLVGMVLGAGAGAELNQALGLEADSDFSTGLAMMLAGGAAALARVPKTVAKGTVAGRMVRAQEANELMRYAPVRAISQEFERASGIRLNRQVMQNTTAVNRFVNQRYTQVRAGPATDSLDLTSYGNILQHTMDDEALTEIALHLGRTDVRLAARWMALGGVQRQSFVRRAGARATIPLHTHFAPDEIVTLRQGLGRMEQTFWNTPGQGGLAQQTSRMIDTLDVMIQANARAGNQSMAALMQATRMADLNFTQRGLANYLNSHKTPFAARGHSGFELNVGLFERDLEAAAESLRQGRRGRNQLVGLARELDRNPGSYRQFRADLARLSNLDPRNNIQFFGNTFGVLTRGAAIAAETTFVNAFSEILMNPVGRQIMLKVMEVAGPTMTPPLLAMTLTATRAAMAGEVSPNEIDVIDMIRKYGRAMRSAIPNVEDVTISIGKGAGQTMRFGGELLKDVQQAPYRDLTPRQIEARRRRLREEAGYKGLGFQPRPGEMTR